MAANTGMFNSRPTALIYYTTTLLYNYRAQEPIRGTLNKINTLQRSAFSLFGWRDSGNVKHLRTHFHTHRQLRPWDYLLSFCCSASTLQRAGSVRDAFGHLHNQTQMPTGRQEYLRSKRLTWSLLFIEAHIEPFTNLRALWPADWPHNSACWRNMPALALELFPFVKSPAIQI